MDPGYLLPLQAGAPAADPSLRQQLRRLALKRYGLGEDDSADPVRTIETPGGTGLYHTSQIADASVDHSQETNWKRRKTQAIIDAAIAGLGGLDPRSGGLSGFLGSAAQAAGRVRGAFDARMAEQEPQGPPIPAEMLKYAFGEDRQPTEFEQYQADPQGYARFKQAGLKPEYDLRATGPRGRLQYLPRPGTPGGPIDTGVDAPPPTPLVVQGAEGFYAVPRSRGGVGTPQPLAAPGGGQLQGQPSQGERQAAMMQVIVDDAQKELRKLEGDPSSHSYLSGILLQQRGDGGLVSGLKSQVMTLIGNPILTPAQQQYNLQVRRFLTSLYALSGKQINEGEWAGLIQQYGYTPGDTAETLKAKAQARDVLASSLAIPAGRAAVVPQQPTGAAPALLRRPDPSPQPSVPRPQNTTSPTTVDPSKYFRPGSTP